MKVLFAVSNESISESIVKKYQKEYKEIISYKNVYYFNAILKEIERDKSYDRIVISEDLEPFANNNYETIDRFLFERLDGISDEASNGEGADTPIILICTDRRSKSDSILLKLFSIGIYNAIIGQDRSIDEVCRLINKPRTKKDAKIYYKIEADDASYQAENEENVSEVEIQNIIAHYKRLGKNTDKFVDSFNNIAAQYTDQQLKVIIKFLPLNVKAVLEAESPKYQEIMTFSNGRKKKGIQARVKMAGDSKNKTAKVPKVENVKIDLLENQGNDFLEPKSNVIVPTAVNVKKVKKQKVETEAFVDLDELETLKPSKNKKEEIEEIEPIKIEKSKPIEEKEEVSVATEPVKKKRGRPKKVLTEEEKLAAEQKPKRGRGRPKKVVEPQPIEEIEEIEPIKPATSKKKKTTKKEIVDNDEFDEAEDIKPIDLFDLADDEDNELDESEDIKPIDLFNLADDDEEDTEPEVIEEEDDEFIPTPQYTKTQTRQVATSNSAYESVNIENLLTRDKKVVAFVGAPKNGTSFLVNNLAFQFAQMGINTAILDTTQNKNSYYIYTKNEENLRKTAFECIDKLKEGVADGLVVNKNLTVYTSLPGTNNEQNDIGTILSTLVQKHSLVLLDCDFGSHEQYFVNAQEIYLVQSMDILTIQPLTAFLRELKTKNLLAIDKLRIIINKELKVKGLSPKVLIGGMSFYNEPAMTFMTELFDKERAKYCTIPFEVENYAKYLEDLVDCNISINAYSKTFIANLKALANMVYPLISRQNYGNNEISNNYEAPVADTKVKRLFKFNK